MSSAVPADTNLQIVRGDAASFTLTVTFPLSAVSVDLNDYAITMTGLLSLSDAPATAIFTLTKGAGITVDGTHLNVAHIVLSSEATEDLDCPPPLFRSVLSVDIEIIGPDEKPYTIMRGTFTVYADATRNS